MKKTTPEEQAQSLTPEEQDFIDKMNVIRAQVKAEHDKIEEDFVKKNPQHACEKCKKRIGVLRVIFNKVLCAICNERESWKYRIIDEGFIDVTKMEE